MPFCCFKIFLGEIHREFFFLDIKFTISEMSTDTLRKFVFLTMIEKGHVLRKIWICLNNFFLLNQKKGTNFNKNCFSPQSEPHTAKLCLSVVFKYFGENSQRTSLLVKKVTLSEMSTKIFREFVFLTMFEKMQIRRKIWICLNFFFFKPVKRDKY